MHRFWNAGDDELVCTGYVRPPDNLEYFLSQIYASMRENGGKRRRLFDVAHLLTRYRTEFGMAVPPPPVQRMARAWVERIDSNRPRRYIRVAVRADRFKARENGATRHH